MISDIEPVVMTSMRLEDELNADTSSLGFYLLSKEDSHRQDYVDGLVQLDKTVAALQAMPLVRADGALKEMVASIAQDIGQFIVVSALKLRPRKIRIFGLRSIGGEGISQWIRRKVI